jgi:ribulose 1,5-bisphosphate synthetase/thiazole synthase
MRSVAIVGSGPSGLFLAKNLLKILKKDLKIDIFEKLNAPFGLLKYGVAPDHPEIKVNAKYCMIIKTL